MSLWIIVSEAGAAALGRELDVEEREEDGCWDMGGSGLKRNWYGGGGGGDDEGLLHSGRDLFLGGS